MQASETPRRFLFGGDGGRPHAEGAPRARSTANVHAKAKSRTYATSHAGATASTARQAGSRPAAALAPASITLLYESRDGKLCLFEDGDGHLTAVRAARLA